MNISQIKQSRFLTRADVGRGVLVTITGVTQENVGQEGQQQELRWCLHFTETEKPMVMNSTNAQIIAQILHNEETDAWVGHKIVLYDDPSVSFGGKLVGGIRVRAPKNQGPSKPLFTPPPVAPPPQQLPLDEAGPDDSEQPF